MKSTVFYLLLAMVVLTGCASTGGAAASGPHYLLVVNDGEATVTAFAAKPKGSDEWGDIDVGESRTTTELRPGSNVEVALRHGCVYDLRGRFADGKMVTVTDFNACKLATLHLGAALRKGRAQADKQ